MPMRPSLHSKEDRIFAFSARVQQFWYAQQDHLVAVGAIGIALG